MRRSAIVCAAHCAWFLGGVHCMFVTSAGGRRFGAGFRWQSRHQLMLSGVDSVTTSIWSIRPWQVTQATPARTWERCSK